jgi:hypothetical protein
MQSKNLLPYISVTLILLALATQNVSAQAWLHSVQITSVVAPASVPAGQPLTVTITAAYTLDLMAPDNLVIELREHTETGNALPTTSASDNCYQPSTEAICYAQTVPNLDGQGVFSVSFALTAPNQPETWRPSALAYIVEIDVGSPYNTVGYSFRVLTITVT